MNDELILYVNEQHSNFKKTATPIKQCYITPNFRNNFDGSRTQLFKKNIQLNFICNNHIMDNLMRKHVTEYSCKSMHESGDLYKYNVKVMPADCTHIS